MRRWFDEQQQPGGSDEFPRSRETPTARPDSRVVLFVRALLVAVTLALAVLARPHANVAASDDDALIAMGLCEDMDYYINELVDYTETKCIPQLNSSGTNFIFVTSKPIFSVEASKKAWILIVAAAFGHAFNRKSKYRVGSLYLADITMVPNLNYLVLSGALAKTLQSQIYRGQIGAEAMWNRINSSMKSYQGHPKAR